jgi:hypothetical protein
MNFNRGSLGWADSVPHFFLKEKCGKRRENVGNQGVFALFGRMITANYANHAQVNPEELNAKTAKTAKVEARFPFLYGKISKSNAIPNVGN